MGPLCGATDAGRAVLVSDGGRSAAEAGAFDHPGLEVSKGCACVVGRNLAGTPSETSAALVAVALSLGRRRLLRRKR